MTDRDFAALGEALAVGRAALAAGEIPVGAVVLDATGKVVASAHNEREARHDPTATPRSWRCAGRAPPWEPGSWSAARSR